jgi:hypothetical protein
MRERVAHIASVDDGQSRKCPNDADLLIQPLVSITTCNNNMSESNGDTVRDASDVGIPCSICSSIDFLPFRCAHCQLVFCKEHSNQARPEGHDCPAYSSTIVSENERKSSGSATFKGLLPGEDNSPCSRSSLRVME